MNIHKKKKIGLVLSGGGIKAAAYHIGVCLALQEKGFKFSGGSREVVQLRKSDAAQSSGSKTSPLIELYVGSSAGAFVSSVLASGRSLESLITAFQVGVGTDPYYQIDPNDRLKPIGYRHVFNVNGRRILSFLPQTFFEKSIFAGGLEVFLKKGFKLNGLFNANGIERYLRKYVLDENDFQRLGPELYIISTQLNHSRKTIFGPYLESSKSDSIRHIGYAKISEAVAASVSLPPLFAPYPIKKPDGTDLYHYDGEIRDTLSTHVAADHGADLIIASYSMQPYHYSPEIGSLHKYGMPAIINQALYQALEQKVARHIQFQTQKTDLYNTLVQIAKEENLSVDLKNKILNAVKDKTGHMPNVDYIYISPRHENHEMFFADHFSLNPKILEKIVWIGFKSGINALREHL
jgi:predicted acylesterase/phospholipase RssA